MKRPQYRASQIAMILAGATTMAPCVASAQVLEIDSTGAVETYAGPVAFKPDGSHQVLRAAHGAVVTRRLKAHQFGDAALMASQSVAVSPYLVEAVAWRESRFQPRIVSRAGAVGEMQLMPATAKMLGVDPYDSAQNYRGGAAYLDGLMRRYHGDLVLTLAAYNAGPGAVDKYGGVPPFKETKDYVGAILDRLSWRAGADNPVKAAR